MRPLLQGLRVPYHSLGVAINSFGFAVNSLGTPCAHVLFRDSAENRLSDLAVFSPRPLPAAWTHTGGFVASGATPCPAMEGLGPGSRATREVSLNLLVAGGGFLRGLMGAA